MVRKSFLNQVRNVFLKIIIRYDKLQKHAFFAFNLFSSDLKHC